MANIHAGEVDGKEALLMLARDIATRPGRSRCSRTSSSSLPDLQRRRQREDRPRTTAPSRTGPPTASASATNAQGLDLNRDFVKLESPEVRALVKLLNQWDPAVVIDCHTTNGSYHRYTLTYEGGRGTRAGGARRRSLATSCCPTSAAGWRSEGLPVVLLRQLLAATARRWETVPATPRYGTQYVGLRNRIAILSESYIYAPFKDRVLASRDFVRTMLRVRRRAQGRGPQARSTSRGAGRRSWR